MKKFLLSLITLILVILIGYFYTPLSLSANNLNYSSVLEDLAKDPDFHKEDYKQGDTVTLNIVQVAESKNKELFIYVYEPNASNKELLASSINISTDINNLEFLNYNLSLLSDEDYFYKYLVLDFTVSNDKIRYYDISSIYTKSLSQEEINNGYVEKAFEVGQRWCLEDTLDGSIKYTAQAIETVTITDKYNSYLQYSNGFYLYQNSSCRSHYIAFSTDYDITKLLEADVTFVTTFEQYQVSGLSKPKLTFGEPNPQFVKLLSTDTVSHKGNGWFAKKYTWNRIEKVEDFISNEDLTSYDKNEIKEMQYVLRFYETEHYSYNYCSFYNEYGTCISYTSGYDTTRVTSVTILRLKFEVGKQTYNLGVVDNKTNDLTPDTPGNNNTNDLDIPNPFDFLGNAIGNLVDGIGDLFNGLTKGARDILRIVGFGVIGLASLWLLSIVVPLVKDIFKKE